MIIAFLKGTDGLVFEELKSDLFDHLLAVLPDFELSIFQRPTNLLFRSEMKQHE
jgi:hypothetical protein